LVYNLQAVWQNGAPMEFQIDNRSARAITVASILIIDDDELFRSMLIDLLKIEGYEILSAADGVAGLKMFRESIPDLVITDIVMPDKEGIQTIRELLQENPETKIIAISGGGRRAMSPDYLTLAKEFGAKRTFAKPFERSEFIEAVRELLGEAA